MAQPESDIPEMKGDDFQGSERELRLIMDSIPMLIARLDRNVRYLYANAAYLNGFGLRSEQIIGRTMQQVLGESAWGKARSRVQRALQGETVECEEEVPDLHGERRSVRVQYIPDRNSQGEVIGMIKLVQDIAAQKKTELALIEREREFQNLAENSPDVIARIGPDLRHRYINRAAETVFGIKTAEFIGRTKAEMGFPDVIASAFEKASRDAFSSGNEQAFDFQIDAEISPRYFTTRIIPEFNQWSEVQSALVIIYDITQRKGAEHERDELLLREQAARSEAEAATRVRDQFLGVVSHELRTPLNSIQSWAHVLESQTSVDSSIIRRALDGIKTGIDQQVRLIEDLLDMTRALSGKLQLSRQPVKLKKLLEGILHSFSQVANERRIGLVNEIRLGDETVEGDPGRIQQMVWNLLGNAAKFSEPEGTIWFSAKLEGAYVHIGIRDNGKGIAAEFLPLLFDPFRQADDSNTRRTGGIGLGLALVYRLAELHGGYVDAESAGEGRGSSFSIFLPVHRSALTSTVLGGFDEANAFASDLPSLDGTRILLVDDERDALEALQALLRHVGARVETAESGMEARVYLSSAEAAELPQVMICDIAMPGEDGYQTLKKIREWENEVGIPPERGLPAIALTAFTDTADRQKALAAGFQVHLSKPVAPADLIGVIARMVRPLH